MNTWLKSLTAVTASRRGLALMGTAVVLAIALACSFALAQTVDTIYTGGDIVIVNDKQPTAEDKAISDNTTIQGAWLLTHLGDKAVPEGVEAPSLTIAPDGVVGGFTGVNRLNGKLSDDGDKLFGPLVTTRRAGPPAAMTVEAAFLKALEQAIIGKRTEGMLELLDRDGNVLAVLQADQR